MQALTQPNSWQSTDMGAVSLEIAWRLGLRPKRQTSRRLAQLRSNLLHRPAKPAKGNGRVQQGCLRAFWAHNAAITAPIAIEFAYAVRLISEKPRRSFYINATRALESIGAQRIGRAKTIGRPYLWKLRDMDGNMGKELNGGNKRK